jgi:hypothetical protein
MEQWRKLGVSFVSLWMTIKSLAVQLSGTAHLESSCGESW